MGFLVPRKVWKQKNRYCWNSNLSEEMFLVLLRLYCTGYTCTRAAEVIARYARKYSTKKISRQTVNRYYLMLGDYLYEMLPDRHKIENYPLELDDDMPEGEEERQRYVAGVVLQAFHQVLYNKLERDAQFNEILIGNKTILAYDALKAFSIPRRGYPLRTFNAHLAFAMWFILLLNKHSVERIWRILYQMMTVALEQDPLDARYKRSLRLIGV